MQYKPFLFINTTYACISRLGGKKVFLLKKNIIKVYTTNRNIALKSHYF